MKDFVDYGYIKKKNRYYVNYNGEHYIVSGMQQFKAIPYYTFKNGTYNAYKISKEQFEEETLHMSTFKDEKKRIAKENKKKTKSLTVGIKVMSSMMIFSTLYRDEMDAVKNAVLKIIYNSPNLFGTIWNNNISRIYFILFFTIILGSYIIEFIRGKKKYENTHKIIFKKSLKMRSISFVFFILMILMVFYTSVLITIKVNNIFVPIAIIMSNALLICFCLLCTPIIHTSLYVKIDPKEISIEPKSDLK
ncbi:MAG: hypothetical protein ACRC5R_00770 [Mycoplasmatales bacterium]